MSNLFHENVPLEFIGKVFDVMQRARHHTFQNLDQTCRTARQRCEPTSAAEHCLDGSKRRKRGIYRSNDHLRSTPAFIKFLSLEPLLGPLENLNLEVIDWAIAGGEGGPAARPMEPDWVRSIRDQCIDAGVAYQWGGVQRKQTGRVLEGRTWDGTSNREGIRDFGLRGVLRQNG